MTVNVSEVRKAWTARYGAAGARRMLGAAYNNSFGPPPAVMAMDALPPGLRRARDEEEAPDPRIARARVFLQNRLSRGDFQRFSAILSGEDDDGGYDPDADPEAQRSPEGGLTRRSGQDQPPPFKGMPRPGGQMDQETHLLPGTEPNIPARNRRETEGGGAGPRDVRGAEDSRGSGYFDRFPSNAGVDVNNYGSRGGR